MAPAFFILLYHTIYLSFLQFFFSLLILISWFSFEICVCHTLLCETRSVGDRAKFSILIRLTYTSKQIYTHFYRIDADVRKKKVTQWNVRQSIEMKKKLLKIRHKTTCSNSTHHGHLIINVLQSHKIIDSQVKATLHSVWHTFHNVSITNIRTSHGYVRNIN